MNCPHCASATTKKQLQKATLGYQMFRCSACKRLFNERTGTPFNFLEYPTDIVLLVVLWRLRYKLRRRRSCCACFWSAAGSSLTRPFGNGKHGLLHSLQNRCEPARRGPAGRSWYVDETYVKVKGKWCYLSRAIDTDGHLVDSRSPRETG
jgi:putative transposase